jgi:hypothetical protein
MAIDASIPLGVQPMEIQSPVNAFAKMQALQGMQQQNAMNALAMQERQRTIADEANLNRIYGQAYDDQGRLDRNKLFSGMAGANLGAKIPAAQKLLSDQDKAQLETRKIELENTGKLVGGVASLMYGVKDQASYDAARNAVAQQYGAEAANRLPLMFNPNDVQRRVNQALTISDQIQREQKNLDQQLNQDKFAWQKQTDTATLNETIRGHNLTNARALEQLRLQREQGKVPSGYRALSDGTLEAIPGGPADKLGESQMKQLNGVNNLRDAIGRYQQQLDEFGTLGLVSPSARAKMGTLYNNMMLFAKEAYNLGVLNGPDYQIMTDMLTDPRSMKGLIISRDDMKSQTNLLDSVMQKVGENVSQRRPVPGGASGNPQPPFGDNPFSAAQHPPQIETLLQRYGGQGASRR